MTNHATPQTATRLKQAGFKQPEQKPGQFWYLQNRLYFIVAILSDTVGKTAILYEVCEENRDPDPLPVRLPFSDVFVYALSTMEVLQALGWEWRIGYMEEIKKYFCVNDQRRHFLYYNFDSAEACAEAWEAKQKHP
jgi:hypothetical protein